MTDRDYMQRAIELAKKGRGWTNPNPMVGAVIVKDGRIIGEGYHVKCGELHAERSAFANLTESAKGATIYVTLEPCCHYGKQPPCTEAVIENGIKRVVIGSRDPNPLVAGKGVAILREAGIEVVEDFMREECDSINPVFFHYITKKIPYVVVKYAMTADGKIATHTGASKWITGEKSREQVMRYRADYMAIMAGIGTVLADNPTLNARLEGARNPVRVIMDSKLSIPMDSNICNTAKEYRTILACRKEYIESEAIKVSRLKDAGVEVAGFEAKDGSVDATEVLKYLGSIGIDSVFVEGGGTLNDSLFKANAVNEVKAFIAPKIFGGANAKSPVEGSGVAEVNQAAKLELKSITTIDTDVLIEYKVVI